MTEYSNEDIEQVTEAISEMACEFFYPACASLIGLLDHENPFVRIHGIMMLVSIVGEDVLMFEPEDLAAICHRLHVLKDDPHQRVRSFSVKALAWLMKSIAEYAAACKEAHRAAAERN